VKTSTDLIRTCVASKDGKNMQRVIEVYNLAQDWDKQLRQQRCFNY
jgi:hypothetical protein